MKVMILAFVAIVVIAVSANFGLRTYAGFSTQERTTVGKSVRLD
ncbi:hypothetical protein [Oceaniglobus ichthyenteri]|nr:hypothetical protein [Oceaniglobus ichthyenteri]